MGTQQIDAINHAQKYISPKAYPVHIHGARWRRGDLMATLIFQGKRLTVVFSSATDHSIPAFVPEGATDVAKALTDAGVLLMAKPEGVLL
jgi:hypothetical protein